jgi:hypothetical protein
MWQWLRFILMTGLCAAFVPGAMVAAHAQVGVVRTVEGQVNVYSGREECAPRYGLDLDEGDAVRTGPKSWALLFMMDGARITVRPESEVRIDRYRYSEAAEPGVNRVRLSLKSGGVRVTTSRVATTRGGVFEVVTPDAAAATLRGVDQDVAYVAQKPAAPGDAAPGTYTRTQAGAATLGNSAGKVELTEGQAAYAAKSAATAPRLLASRPYFYYWYDHIDRRAAAVAEKLDPTAP